MKTVRLEVKDATLPTALQEDFFKVTISNTLPAGFFNFCTETVVITFVVFFSKKIVSFRTLKLYGLAVSKKEPSSSWERPHILHKNILGTVSGNSEI